MPTGQDLDIAWVPGLLWTAVVLGSVAGSKKIMDTLIKYNPEFLGLVMKAEPLHGKRAAGPCVSKLQPEPSFPDESLFSPAASSSLPLDAPSKVGRATFLAVWRPEARRAH